MYILYLGMDEVVVAHSVPLLLAGEALEDLGPLRRQVHLYQHRIEPAL